MSVLTPSPKMQFVGIDGEPLVNGRLYTYEAGTTTPASTYTDNTEASLNPNPVILNARGEASVWLGTAAYKFKLTDSSGNEIWTVDYISAPISSISPTFSGSVNIVADTSNPALKITQLGSGLAIRVQDSTDPDASPFVVDSTGNVGIKTASPTSALTINDGDIRLQRSGSAVGDILTNASFLAINHTNSAGFLNLQIAGASKISISNTFIALLNRTITSYYPSSEYEVANKGYVDNILQTAVVISSPPGVVQAFAGSSVPVGWLLCDGSPVSRTTWAALFAAIGTTWGAGDGSTTFNVPDLRGAFLRGAGAGLNPASRAVGSYEADGNKSHTHTATQADHNHTSNYPALSLQTVGGSTVNISYFTGGVVNPNTSNVSGGPPAITVASSGNTEATVKNFAVIYMIKV